MTLASSPHFMPHGHCYLWEPGVLWAEIVTNSLIGLAYVAISFTLAVIVVRVRQLPFRWMYLAFGVFIVTCGVTHFFDVWVIWNPDYWVDSGVRAVTAVASVGTALALPRLVPQARGLARGAEVARKRGVELETVVEDLERLYERTVGLAEMKNQFFANVSHELRTPLTLVLSPVEKLLAADNLTAEQRRDLDMVARNARTLLHHVNDLLDFSKIDAGVMRVESNRVDIGPFLRDLCNRFAGLATDRGIELELDITGDACVELDAPKMERIAANLLSNALKFTPEGGWVRFRAHWEETSAQLSIEVSDSGPGVPPEQSSLVFERFRQIDGSSTRARGGTGLGLAIAKELVELQSGSIGVGASERGGARFWALLPAPSAEAGKAALTRASSLVDHPAEVLKAKSDFPPRMENRGAPVVLVVDDDADMRGVLRSALEDYDVIVAADGEGALEVLQSRDDVDLVVTDLMMPKLDGAELVRRIRRGSDVPVILLTARADDDVRVRVLEEGAQDWLSKPFSTAELLARARNLISQKRAGDVLRRELESRSQNLEDLAGELKRRSRELASTLESVRTARQHAEQASQLKTSFLRLVSHELRTPLAALQLQLDRFSSVKRDSLSERQRQILERMQHSMRRLTDLIESLLEYARIESGRLDVDRSPVDVRDVARRVVDELAPVAERKGLLLTLTPVPELPSLQTDARLLSLVLTNLVSNAVKFTDEGEVRIELAPANGGQRITVADTGPGILGGGPSTRFRAVCATGADHAQAPPGVGARSRAGSADGPSPGRPR